MTKPNLSPEEQQFLRSCEGDMPNDYDTAFAMAGELSAMRDSSVATLARVADLNAENAGLRQQLAEINGLVPWPPETTTPERVRRMLRFYGAASGSAIMRLDAIGAAIDECEKWKAHHAAKGNMENAGYWEQRAALFRHYAEKSKWMKPDDSHTPEFERIAEALGYVPKQQKESGNAE